MSRRSRIPFSDIARRITGISVLSIFGVNWQPPEDRRDIVRRLVIFLEDRRALYADYHMEHGPWVERSVIEMRAELTKILETCPDDEGLTGPIRAMRAACRKFLDEAQHPGRSRLSASPWDAAPWLALGELRGVFGLHLARLCAAYGVDVEAELASILPSPDMEDQGPPTP